MTELLTLKNGVRVVADPMPGLESAAVGVWVRAGAIDETLEEHGVAHLLEHMAFKGTKTRSARRIVEEIESVGGFLNASTGYSRTGYFARVLRGDVERAIDIVADILTNPVFDAGELVKEHEVVIQEIGEANDVPDDVVMEMLQGLSFGDHPLGRPILGTIESVSSHTRERLFNFMTKHYAPTDLVLAASGAIDVDRIAILADRYFGGLSSSARAPRSPKPSYAGGVRHDARKIEQTHVALALPGPAVTDPDYFAARVFAEALGGGMSSRIFQCVREERGLAYTVQSFMDSYDDVGAIGAYAGTDGENAPECLSLVRREIEDMARSATGEETDRARALLKSTLLMGLESPANRTEVAVGQLFAYGRLLSAAELTERLDAVGRGDVSAAAGKALSGRPSLAIVGPADLDAATAAFASH